MRRAFKLESANLGGKRNNIFVPIQLLYIHPLKTKKPSQLREGFFRVIFIKGLLKCIPLIAFIFVLQNKKPL